MVAHLHLPPPSNISWHLNLRLSIEPDRTRLQAFTYALTKAGRVPSKQLFVPRTVDRPETDWDAIQALAYGVDILSSRR